MRPFTDSDVAHRTRRARYLAGQIGDHQVRAYVDEEGVNPRHGTETFAEMELELDNWRWPGTVFRLRTGKALGRDRKEVAVHFRPVPHLPFGHGGDALPNVLRFGLDAESLTLDLTGIGARAHPRPAGADRTDRSARAARLRPAPAGRAERQCRLVDPRRRGRRVLAGCRAGAVSLVEGSRPLLEYPAGSRGPGAAAESPP